MDQNRQAETMKSLHLPTLHRASPERESEASRLPASQWILEVVVAGRRASSDERDPGPGPGPGPPSKVIGTCGRVLLRDLARLSPIVNVGT